MHRLAPRSGSLQGGGSSSAAARLGTSGVGVEVVGAVGRRPAVGARRDADRGRSGQLDGHAGEAPPLADVLHGSF